MINKTKNVTIQKGFTLVELAIVLVIIGLIVSSVLVGQDLIKASQLRATTRQLQEFQVGVNTFIGKYNGVPGDLLAATATSFGLVGAGTGADGNGTITDTGGATTIATYTSEIANFWSALTTPGKELISGTYRGTACSACTTGIDFPAMKFGGGGWGAYGVSGINYFLAGSASPSTTTATTTTNVLLPMDAYNIDSKIDDGMPNTGSVMAGSSGTTFVTPLAPSTSCASSTAATGIYVYATATVACSLQFQMQTF